ncbi:MAG: hypothetical protein VX185_16240 [Pseudomonadota bacterium]|nr:hypothetical protein [Pseudomonadota bacterium]
MPRLLTADEKEALRKVCSEVDNWTAMGLWKGYGKEPNCYNAEKHKTTLTLITDFKNQQDADKWNSKVDKQVRYKGYAVGTLVAAITAPYNLSVLQNTVLAIAQGETLASFSKAPKAKEGSKFIVIITYDYQWSPHPAYRKSLKIETRSVMVDITGKGTYESKSVEEFYIGEIPDSVARAMSMAPQQLFRVEP